MGLVNTVVPLADSRTRASSGPTRSSQMSPTAIRFLKAAFIVATDGLAGLQEFAGNATGLFYMTDEAHEGTTAFLEKRPPDTASTRAARERRRARSRPRARPSTLRIWLLAAGDTARGAVAAWSSGWVRRSAPAATVPARHGVGLRGRGAAAPGRRQLRQRPLRLPTRRRHAGPAGAAAGRRGRPRHRAPARGGDRDHHRPRRASSGCGSRSSAARS